MNRKPRTKFIHEGEFVAEVEVDLLETNEGWSPYLSLEDAYKLDDVRESLRQGRSSIRSQTGEDFPAKTSNHSVPREKQVSTGLVQIQKRHFTILPILFISCPRARSFWINLTRALYDTME